MKIMAWVRTTAVVGAAALAAGSAGAAGPAKPPAKPQPAAVHQVVTGPVAVYWMSAQTSSGFGAGMMGGGAGGPGGGRGGRPSMGAMMGMMTGGGLGGGAQHNLILQLGSSRKPTGAPQAEHLPPQGLGAGASLPLVTPVAQPSQKVEEGPSMPREYQKPKGKMLIFWGCGDHARPNQPVVIDFAQMADGKMPAGLEALSRGLGVTPMQPPSPSRNTTYGEWPNEKTRTTVPGRGSLVGEHNIHGTYSPDIHFALSQNQDFLAPLQLTTNAIGPMGSGQLGWNSVAGAGGYLATAIGGGKDQETVVLWTSSEIQASAFALPDYLSNSDLSRLVASKALMGPQTTSCAVPREVVQAAPQALVQLVAYGQETNLSYPARPQDPHIPWNIEWTVKVRYKSQTGGLLGMTMPGMGGGMSADDGEGSRGPGARGQQQPPKPRGRPGLGDVLRGLGNIPQL
jgi:hypothetical protein